MMKHSFMLIYIYAHVIYDNKFSSIVNFQFLYYIYSDKGNLFNDELSSKTIKM